MEQVLQTVNPAVTVIPTIVMNTGAERIRLNSKIAAHNADIRQTIAHTHDIKSAEAQLRRDVAATGKIYAKNPEASIAGHQAEPFHAGTVNVDATIKKSPVRAVAPDSRLPGIYGR